MTLESFPPSLCACCGAQPTLVYYPNEPSPWLVACITTRCLVHHPGPFRWTQEAACEAWNARQVTRQEVCHATQNT